MIEGFVRNVTRFFLVLQSLVPVVFFLTVLDTVSHECMFRFVVKIEGINYYSTLFFGLAHFLLVQTLSIILFAI